MRAPYAIILLLLVFGIQPAEAQNTAQKSDVISIERAGVVHPRAVAEDWAIHVQNLEAPFPGSGSYRGYLEEIKKQIKPDPRFGSSQKNSGVLEADTPVLGRNFDGNPYNFSVPCDNDVAISDEGYLISVVNTNIRAWDTNVDTVMWALTLEAFATPLGISGNKYDPKVVFDPREERFIIVWLNGSDSSTSQILIAFSTSSNPNDPWNLYSVAGNPNMDNTWSDYPIVGLTNDELFVTVNLLRTGEPWQTGFAESLVWQIDKGDGYAGDPINTLLWSGIGFGGKPLRNLCPIQGGITTYGPDIYLISNRNFALSNDTIWMVHISGKLTNPTTMLTVDFGISDQVYGAPPNAFQPGGRQLQTNDARVLGGFYENGNIHFVGNTVYSTVDTALAGVYHGIIRDVDFNPSISGHIIGDTRLDFGYPNISHSGQAFNDEEAIISYNHSSAGDFPGVSATFWSDVDGYSKRLQIKEGDDYVSVIGTPERWGDYSGSQRRYNEPGNVWISGFWGVTRNVVTQHINATWIAELSSQDTFNPPIVGITEADVRTEARAFPNPAWDFVSIEFELDASAFADIAIYDLDGRLVKLLRRDRIKKGKNLISFSTRPLSQGQYVVVGQSGEKILFRQKIVVAR